MCRKIFAGWKVFYENVQKIKLKLAILGKTLYLITYIKSAEKIR